MNPEKRALLPKMAFSGFAARYREPSAAEGFQDITRVDFKVCAGLQAEWLWCANVVSSLRVLRSRKRNGESTGFPDSDCIAYRLRRSPVFLVNRGPQHLIQLSAVQDVTTSVRRLSSTRKLRRPSPRD